MPLNTHQKKASIRVELKEQVLTIENPCTPLTKEQIETAFSLLPSSKGTTGGGKWSRTL